jgi:hypothetical protein
MPYKDPERQRRYRREWDEKNRPERSSDELRRLHLERDRKRLDETTRLAYEESERSQRANASHDNETSWGLSPLARKMRLGAR